MPIPPDSLVNHTEEQQLVDAMRRGSSDIRVLMFAERAGRGKSSLMRRLELNCQRPGPDVAVALIDLKRPDRTLSIKSPYELAGAMVDALSDNDDAFATFKPFRTLREAYEGGNPQPFGFAPTPPNLTVNSNPILRGVRESDVVATNIMFGGVDKPFTETQGHLAQTKCVTAFLDNLRVLLIVEPLIVLIDSWEMRDEVLRRWVERRLIRDHIAKTPASAQLRLVVAGLPNDRSPTGITENEFSSFFLAADYTRHVQRRGLSRIEEHDEDVAMFMNQNGGNDIPPDAVIKYRPAVAEMMKGNLESAEKFVRYIARSYTERGELSA